MATLTNYGAVQPTYAAGVVFSRTTGTGFPVSASGVPANNARSASILRFDRT